MTREDIKNDKALMECYRRLFKNATPPANFDELLENAKINKMGQKEIPFMDYEISQKRMDEIIKEVIKEFKVKKHYHDRFKTTVYLGCSPKSKMED
jgi:hypothetical protein